MKKSIKLILVLAGLLFSTAVSAQEIQVQVPAECAVVDLDGLVHTFPKDSSPEGFLGICAFAWGLQEGLIDDVGFSNAFPQFGLFVTRINGVTADSSSEYWALWHNDEFAGCGIGCLPVVAGDKISFVLTSFGGQEIGPRIDLRVTALLNSNSSPSARGGSLAAHGLNAKKAVRFLAESQSPNGSIKENPMFTDWAAIAFGSVIGSYDPENEILAALKSYFVSNPDPGVSLGSPVMSFTRRAMALMALGINPYSGTEINYIQEIVKAFDGEQIGDADLVNDDIFALLVLRKAGFGIADGIVRQTTNFILGNQKSDGSWTGGVDITAAAIQALVLVSDIDGVSEVLAKAKTYLQGQQQTDGGFGNVDSTSWAMQAIAALGEDWRTWNKNGDAPGDYLYYHQRPDGSLESATPIWSTAYAVPTVLGKHWGVILRDFVPEGMVAGAFTHVQAPTAKELLARFARQLEEFEKEIKRLRLNLELIVVKTRLKQLLLAVENLEK